MTGLPPKANGYACMSPVDLEIERGTFRRVSCRKCPRCLAAAKQDVTGRCIAEAVISFAVIFATLTYRDDEPGAFQFVKLDWDRAISRLRMAVKREFGTSCKVLYAAERGKNGTQRCHWHALLFFDGPHGIEVPGDPTARAWVDWWPHGHVNLQALSVSDTGQAGLLSRKVRYVAKYLGKTKGQDAAPFGWSKNPIMGAGFLRDLAERHAEAGLIPQNFYVLPGLKFTKGPKAGDHQRFYLRGAGAREFAQAYAARWEALHPGQVADALPWMLSADDGAVDPVLSGKRGKRASGFGRGKRRPVEWVSHDCTAAKTVLIGDRFGGLVRLDEGGRASWHAAGGDGLPVPLGAGLDGLPSEVAKDQRAGLVAWVDHVRGAGWSDPDKRQRARDATVQAILSRDPASRIGHSIGGGGAVTCNGASAGDPLGLPPETPAEFRRRVLAAKLGKP